MTIKGDDHMTLCLREQDLDWRDIQDEIVVLDSKSAVYLGLRGSGAVLWRLLGESATRDSLVEALAATYDVDATRAGHDVDEFLAALNERGLLVS
jgi:uncharacterized NAD(P)/FAD-binding protein YdhS